MSKVPPPKEEPFNAEFKFNRQRVIRIFFFVTFAVILYQLFLLARPFLTALVAAAMLGLAAFPIFIPLRRLVRNNNLASLLLTVAVFLIATVPVAIMGWFLLREADRLGPTVQAFLTKIQSTDTALILDKVPSFLQPVLEPIKHLLDKTDIHPQEKILTYAAQIGGRITSFGAAAARHVVITLINIAVFLIALFFAFRDGESLYRWLLSLIPMNDEDKRALVRRAYETFMAVVLGVMVTASAQGLVAMIGFWIAGVRLPVLLGFATIIASFLGRHLL